MIVAAAKEPAHRHGRPQDDRGGAAENGIRRKGADGDAKRPVMSEPPLVAQAADQAGPPELQVDRVAGRFDLEGTRWRRQRDARRGWLRQGWTLGRRIG